MPGGHGVHALAAHASPRSLLTGRADWSEPWLHSLSPMTEARGLQPLPLISKSQWSFGPQDRAHRLAPAWGHRMPGSPVRRTQALGGPHCPLRLSALPLHPQMQHFDDRAREGGAPAQMWGLSQRPASSPAVPQFPHTFLICPSLHPMEWGLSSPFRVPWEREGAGASSPGAGRRGCM